MHGLCILIRAHNFCRCNYCRSGNFRVRNWQKLNAARNFRAFNFRRLSKWRKIINSENFGDSCLIDTQSCIHYELYSCMNCGLPYLRIPVASHTYVSQMCRGYILDHKLIIRELCFANTF